MSCLEAEIQDVFREMKQHVESLKNVLGNHIDCSYTNRKLADLLFYTGHQDEATVEHEKAYEMNKGLAEASGISYKSNILVLKNWSKCLMKTDPRLALSKLHEAENLVERNCFIEQEYV
jgi:hypothetical protein